MHMKTAAALPLRRPRIVAAAMFIMAVAACAVVGFVMVSGAVPATDDGDHGDELVVLVHGMGRTPLSMLLLEHDLEQDGYRVLNWGYSSTCCTIAELGARLQQDIAAARGDAAQVHFVGHSLGNVIVRWALTGGDVPAGAARHVMLAPPNQGARSADRHAPWLGDVLRPLPELATDPSSTVRRLPVPASVDIGIIAGRHDGKVTVAETRLPGAEHVTVASAHTFVMARPAVRRLVLQFLETGTFASR
jgi:alpha-beta hydrolase superfamily lysophospholipase